MTKALEILNRYHHGIIECNEKELDEAIAELEEAMNPKTCEGCIYAQVRHYSHVTVWFKDTASIRCNKCSRKHDDNFKQKDNA